MNYYCKGYRLRMRRILSTAFLCLGLAATTGAALHYQQFDRSEELALHKARTAVLTSMLRSRQQMDTRETVQTASSEPTPIITVQTVIYEPIPITTMSSLQIPFYQTNWPTGYQGVRESRVGVIMTLIPEQTTEELARTGILKVITQQTANECQKNQSIEEVVGKSEFYGRGGRPWTR